MVKGGSCVVEANHDSKSVVACINVDDQNNHILAMMIGGVK